MHLRKICIYAKYAFILSLVMTTLPPVNWSCFDWLTGVEREHSGGDGVWMQPLDLFHHRVHGGPQCARLECVDQPDRRAEQPSCRRFLSLYHSLLHCPRPLCPQKGQQRPLQSPLTPLKSSHLWRLCWLWLCFSGNNCLWSETNWRSATTTKSVYTLVCAGGRALTPECTSSSGENCVPPHRGNWTTEREMLDQSPRT